MSSDLNWLDGLNGQWTNHDLRQTLPWTSLTSSNITAPANIFSQSLSSRLNLLLDHDDSEILPLILIMLPTTILMNKTPTRILKPKVKGSLNNLFCIQPVISDLYAPWVCALETFALFKSKSSLTTQSGSYHDDSNLLSCTHYWAVLLILYYKLVSQLGNFYSRWHHWRGTLHVCCCFLAV